MEKVLHFRGINNDSPTSACNPCKIHHYKKFNKTNDEKLKSQTVTSQHIPPSWELIYEICNIN
ncbi:hypothetical protein C0J52_02220 [Blattella germanica]|nr:hypothetical protein C0J52_02220 [Blattella germanica]